MKKYFSLFFFRKMKAAVVLCIVSIAVGLASAFPQKDGAIFSNEAIRQAQNTFLIPKDAQIQKVSTSQNSASIIMN